MSNPRTIYVTQPELPPLEDFVASLQGIWDRRILTNGGPCHKRFERALAEHRGVEHLALFANGTLALVTALLLPASRYHGDAPADDAMLTS